MRPQREKLRINELPEGYRLLAVEPGFFVCRDPGGRQILLEQDGHLTGVTTRRRLSAPFGERARRLGMRSASNPYTIPMD